MNDLADAMTRDDDTASKRYREMLEPLSNPDNAHTALELAFDAHAANDRRMHRVTLAVLTVIVALLSGFAWRYLADREEAARMSAQLDAIGHDVARIDARLEHLSERSER